MRKLCHVMIKIGSSPKNVVDASKRALKRSQIWLSERTWQVVKWIFVTEIWQVIFEFWLVLPLRMSNAIYWIRDSFNTNHAMTSQIQERGPKYEGTVMPRLQEAGRTDDPELHFVNLSSSLALPWLDGEPLEPAQAPCWSFCGHSRRIWFGGRLQIAHHHR